MIPSTKHTKNRIFHLIVSLLAITDKFTLKGTEITKTGPEINALVGGVAGGYKIARGQATTSTASDTIVTGLTTVVSVVATLDSDPVDGCQVVTASIGNQTGAPAAGSIYLKTWKATAADNSALIAATTFSKKVNWVAVGL